MLRWRRSLGSRETKTRTAARAIHDRRYPRAARSTTGATSPHERRHDPRALKFTELARAPLGAAGHTHTVVPAALPGATRSSLAVAGPERAPAASQLRASKSCKSSPTRTRRQPAARRRRRPRRAAPSRRGSSPRRLLKPGEPRVPGAETSKTRSSCDLYTSAGAPLWRRRHHFAARETAGYYCRRELPISRFVGKAPRNPQA